MNRREVITTLNICSYLVVALGLLYYFIFDVKIGEGSQLVIVVACAFLYMLIRKYFFPKKPESFGCGGDFVWNSPGADFLPIVSLFAKPHPVHD